MQQDPVADLRARWESERSPQVTLQLAEEYRRGGQVVQAIEVLREGLEHHPGHIAARVALGRYLLEAGNLDEASTRLEQVVNEDPTHLVANKLLVEAYLGRGQVEKANDRLEFYALLTEGDPEVGSLRARVSAVAHGFSQAPSEGAEEVAEEVTAVSVEEPFGDLWSGLSIDSYREALAAEGIFGLIPQREPEVLEAVQVTEAVPITETVPITEAVPITEPVAEEEATATLGRLYLQQGHRDEAARIFRSLLAQDPENLEARVGLQAAEADESELSAADLVPPTLLSHSEVAERKRVLLENYLKRLRGEQSGVS